MLPFINGDVAATKLSCLHNMNSTVYGINEQNAAKKNPLFEPTAHTDCCDILQGHMLLSIRRKPAYDGTNKYTKFSMLRLAVPMGAGLHNWLESNLGYFSGVEYYDVDWWTKNAGVHSQTGNGIAVVKVGTDWLNNITSTMSDPVLPLPYGVLITESGVYCATERYYDFSGAHSMTIAFVVQLPDQGLSPNAYYQPMVKSAKIFEQLGGSKLLKEIGVSVQCVKNGYDKDELFAELMALT